MHIGCYSKSLTENVGHTFLHMLLEKLEFKDASGTKASHENVFLHFTRIKASARRGAKLKCSL